MTTTKLYEIRDYSHEPGWVSYMNEDTTSVVDAWTTSISLDAKEFEEPPTAPKQFTKRTEANGRQKPQWKIYPVTVQ